FLDVTVTLRPLEIAAGAAVRTIDIVEGAQFRVCAIHVEGVRQDLEAEIRRVSRLSEGTAFSHAVIERGRAAVDRAYRARGYNGVSVTLRVETIAEPEL